MNKALKSCGLLGLIVSIGLLKTAPAAAQLEYGMLTSAREALAKAKSQASADTTSAPGKVIVPMPTEGTLTLTAEQLQKLAKAAAYVYEKQGKPWLGKWWCVDVTSDPAYTLKQSSVKLLSCMMPKGKVSDGNFELKSVALRMEVEGEGVESGILMSPTSVTVDAADIGRAVIHEDGSVEKKDDDIHYGPFTGPDTMTLIQNELNYWTSYAQ